MFDFLFGWIWRDKDRIRELEGILAAKNTQIDNLNSIIKTKDGKIKELVETLEKVNEDLNSAPGDCKTGEWCAGCSFAGRYFVHDQRTYGLAYTEITTCHKGGACPNYLPKYKPEEDSTDVT